MAAPNLQKDLNHLFQTTTAGLDAATLETMISDNERFMQEPARQLLVQTGLLSVDVDALVVAPRAEPFALLDQACGTGPVAAALLAAPDVGGVVPRSRVMCADFSAALVDALRQRIAACGWEGIIETAVLDAQETNLPSASFSHITINFAMNLIPRPARVLADAHRLLRPGGTLGFTVWTMDNTGLAADLRSALSGLPFMTPPLPDPFPVALHGQTAWVTEAGLAAELGRFRALGTMAGGDRNDDDDERKQGRLVEVEVRRRTHTVRVDGPEHYLRMFAPMIQWVTTSFWDEATRARARADRLLDRHIVRQMSDKYGGEGWDQEWTYIAATCKKLL